MRTSSRAAAGATCTALTALLAACGSNPTQPASTPVGSGYPATSLEYGRVSNIEFLQADAAARGISVPGAIVGGVVGAVAGNAIGGGGGRDAATVLGGAAGAAIGSQVGRSPSVASPVYRVTLQTDSGGWRTYDVPAIGDLRVGDRVRVDHGVIHPS